MIVLAKNNKLSKGDYINPLSMCTAVAEPFSDVGAAIGVSVAAGVAGIGLVGLGIGIVVAILVCPK